MFEQWLAMEQFYYHTFPMTIICGIVIAMILTVIIFHLNRPIIRKITLVLLLFEVGLATFAWSQYKHHEDLIRQTETLDAGIRSLDKGFFFEYPYNYSEIEAYKKLYNNDQFEELAFYTKNVIEEPIQFDGLSGKYAYIQIDKQPYKVASCLIEFSDQVKFPIRKGFEYELLDDRFKDIGFFPKSSIFLEKYLIPLSDQGKTFDFDRDSQYPYVFDQIQKWFIPKNTYPNG